MLKRIFSCISEGLMRTLPIILLGSFVLVLKSLPISGYQDFLNEFLDGYLLDFLSTIYSASLGIFGIVLTVSIAYSYAHHSQNSRLGSYMVSVTALCSYFIMMGMDVFSLDQAGGSSVFVSILAAVISSVLFTTISQKQSSRLFHNYHGMEPTLRDSMFSIRPFAGTLLFFVLAKLLLIYLFGNKTIQDLLSDGISHLYKNMGTNLWSMTVFILSVHLLWMCGIHGSNVLHSVSDTLFEPMVEKNLAQIAAGAAPTHIFSKTFIDTFLIMGGCGASFSLIIALLLFGRKKNLKQVAKVSLIPAVFNVNETLLFGIPLVFNPTFFIPFLTVPLVNLILAYLATVTGFLPVISTQVEWTVPVLLSGYLATGSIRGSIFQFLLLAIGVLIYRPFVLQYERQTTKQLKERIGELTDYFKKNEADEEHPVYLYLSDDMGSIAKMLADELQNAIADKELQIFYQPQVNASGTCFGAEALLRWNYPDVGFIYPPLLIELAKERGILEELEHFVIHTACRDLKQLNEDFSPDLKLSINITGSSLKNPNLIPMLEQAVAEYGVLRKNLWIEVTEQDAISSSGEVTGRLDRLNELGYHLLIDDFGMGHTSLTYLKSSYFCVVKLDGSLTKEYQNVRYQEIISSITRLSQHLQFDVIAEYVETEEQCKKLLELGCTGLQGYLYSKAIPWESFMEWLPKWMP
ncbi:MAG: EAL domain-containing protein [Clostridiales bacterium]|nr:EAL domain-containing protein [Clostridiales bacterium]